MAYEGHVGAAIYGSLMNNTATKPHESHSVEAPLATVAVPPYDLPLALRAVRERSFLDRYHNTIQVMIQYN
jgi:hypothetical protein